MANTTRDEESPAKLAEDEIIVAKQVTKSDLLSAYQKGANYYQLAREFFDSDSDEAVNRVRTIIEGEIEQD